MRDSGCGGQVTERSPGGSVREQDVGEELVSQAADAGEHAAAPEPDVDPQLGGTILGRSLAGTAQGGAPPRTGSMSVALLLALQRTAGNAAVARLALRSPSARREAPAARARLLRQPGPPATLDPPTAAPPPTQTPSVPAGGPAGAPPTTSPTDAAAPPVAPGQAPSSPPPHPLGPGGGAPAPSGVPAATAGPATAGTPGTAADAGGTATAGPAAPPSAGAASAAAPPGGGAPVTGGPAPTSTAQAPSVAAPDGPAGVVFSAFQAQLAGLRARMASSAEATKSEIRTAAEAKKQELHAGIEAQATRVDGAYGTAISDVQGALERERSEILGKRDAELQSTREAADTAKKALFDSVAQKQAALRKSGDGKVAAANEVGETAAKRATGETRVQAANAVSIGEQKAGEWSSHKRGGEIARTAREMAADTAQQVTEAGTEMAGVARKDAGELAGKFRGEIDDAAAELGKAQGAGVDRVDELANAALSTIPRQAQEAIDGLEKSANDVVAELTRQRADAANAVRQLGNGVDASMDEAAQSACSGADRAAADAAKKLDDAEAAVATRIAGMTAEQARTVVARAGADLAAAAAAFEGRLREHSSSTVSSLENGKTQVLQKATSDADEIVAPVDQTAQKFQTDASKVTSDTVAAMGKTGDDAARDIKGVSERVDKELQDAVDKSTSQWADELEKGSAEINDKVTKGLAESKSSVDGLAAKIDEKGDEIENESWLSRAAHFVGGLVVGLLEGLWDLVKVVLVVVLVVIAVVVVALIIGALIAGLAGVLAVIGVIAAIAEFIAAIAGVLLVIAAVIVIVLAIVAIYQAITRDDLTDYERGKLWGHAAFDIATVVFGEEIFGWIAKWFKGVEGAEDAAALARLKALVTDDALLQRLLKLVDGDTARLESLLGKAGNDGAGLEKVLILTGGDVGKTDQLLGLCKGNTAKLEELLKATDGDPDKLLELFKANGDDLAKVEEALKKPDGPAATAGATLPPDLQALRAGLKDPKAIQQFDEQFTAASGSDPATPNPDGVENFRRYLHEAETRGGGDLEQGLLQDFERDHPTNPPGESDDPARDPHGSFTPEAIAENPDLVQGMNPQDLLDKLGGVPEGFNIRPGRSSSKGAGSGWVLSRPGAPGKPGIQICWSPGSARADHPSDPYWVISSDKTGRSARIPAGPWPDGPAPFVQ